MATSTACVVVPLGPACVNLVGVRAGDRNEFTLTLTRQGDPVDLTGLIVTAQARGKVTDTEFIDAVIDIVDPTLGKVKVRWPGEDVRAWLMGKAARTGVWDLQVGSGSGAEDTVTVVAGSFEAEMDVTRP